MIATISEEIQPVRIRVLGVGGAGSNALDQMLQSEIDSIDYIAINTDKQALLASRAPRKIQIGENITHGLGAGGRPDIGRQAAVDSLPVLEEAVEECDILFLVAGFGGGTGTGATPIIAQAARERGVLAVGLATTPFEFEGQRRRAQAFEGLRRVEEFADTVIAVSNDRLFEIADAEMSMVEAFAFTNDILAEGVQCVARLINKTGLINLDFADVRAIMADGGRAALGFAARSGAGRAPEAAEAALDNPLFDRAALAKARGLLISIMGGDDLGLREVREAAEAIGMQAGREAHVIFGAVTESEFRGRRLVTVLATSLKGKETAARHSAGAAAEGERTGTPRQTLIDLDFASQEHFEATEPTIVEGENIDIPTFMRRNIRIEAAAR